MEMIFHFLNTIYIFSRFKQLIIPLNKMSFDTVMDEVNKNVLGESTQPATVSFSFGDKKKMMYPAISFAVVFVAVFAGLYYKKVFVTKDPQDETVEKIDYVKSGVVSVFVGGCVAAGIYYYKK